MSSLASVNLTALSPAMAGTLPSLEHLQSSNYFQQMLITDSALETLGISRGNLELKLQAGAVSEGKPLSAEAAAERDAITQSIAKLEELVRTFEDLQAEARHLFELRARSLRQRETGIMDLPAELLLAIFQNFRPPLDFSKTSPHEGNDGADVETIKSIRLTCLRFRQISSHLLIGRLGVSANMTSLDRLKRISSHPEISRGERILTIDLRHYSASIARDIHAFSAMCFNKLQDSIETWQIAIDSLESDTESLESDTESGSSELLPQRRQRGDYGGAQTRRSSFLPKGVSVESAIDGVRHLERVLSMWKPFRNAGASVQDSAQLDAAVLALQRGHERYKQFYQQQQRLIQDGSFLGAVAATAAASKSKVWLCMSDAQTGPPDDLLRADLEELVRSDFLSFGGPRRFDHALSYMVQPQSWSELGARASGELPQSLLCEVPLAMRTAGTKLAGLEVCLQCPPQMLDLSMSDEQLSCFTEAAEDLEAFKFSTQPFHDGFYVPSSDFSQDLHAYLRAAIGCQIVPNLYLDLEDGIIGLHKVRFPIEPLLRASNWHGLKSAELGNFDVGVEGLRKLIDMLEPGTRLRLFCIRLSSGTWAAALECLRSKVSQDSWLSDPHGAECVDMTEEEYEEIFDSKWTKEGEGGEIEQSKATQYIRSVEGVENPLLVRNTG